MKQKAGETRTAAGTAKVIGNLPGVIAAGDAAPLGATRVAGGVNFSVFSRDADLVELLLFDGPQAAEPEETLPPAVDRQQWRLCIDTGQAAPDDIRPLEEAPIVSAADIVAQPRSIVVLAQLVDAAGFRDARAGTDGR